MLAVRDIYAHYVLHSLATFEEAPPTLEEMLMRRRASDDLGLPYLVAEARGKILGFAYAAPYRPRPAYRFTVEDSVYVADGLNGRGIGSALLGELIVRCEGGRWRQMLAVVGDSANSGSVALHRRFGFELCGNFAISRLQARTLGRYADPAARPRRWRHTAACALITQFRPELLSFDIPSACRICEWPRRFRCSR